MKSSLAITIDKNTRQGRILSFAFILIAMLLGVALPLVLNGAGSSGPIITLGVIAALGGTIWCSNRLPVLALLHIALPATFFFRFEINLFPAFTDYGAAWGMNVSLQLLICVGLCFAYWFNGNSQSEPDHQFPVFFVLTTALLWLWAAVSVIYGKEKWLGFCGLWMLAACILLAWVLRSHFGTKSRLQIILTVIAIGLIVNGAISLLQYKLGSIAMLRIIGGVPEEWQQSIGEGEVPRAAGLIQSANAFAWLLVSLLPLMIAQLLLRGEELRWREKLLYAFAVLFGGIGLILSFARGSWGSLAAATLLLIGLSWWVMPSLQRRKLAFKLMGAGFILSLLSLPFIGLIITRLTEDDRGSAESRLTMAHIAGRIISAYPLVGVGVNSYEAEMVRFDDTADFITSWFPYPVHNIYLHIAGESGIPSLLCFVLLLGWSFWRAFRFLQRTTLYYQTIVIGIISGLTAFLLTGTKEPSALGSSTFRTMFFLLGLLLAVERAAKYEVGESKC